MQRIATEMNASNGRLCCWLNLILPLLERP